MENNRIFGFGKYKGKFIPEVIDSDPQYVKWAYEKLDSFQLTESEKYLLYTRMSKMGIIDESLLADIKELPKIKPSNVFDTQALLNILKPLDGFPFYDQRQTLKEEYEELKSYCEKGVPIAFANGEVGSFNFYTSKVKDSLRTLRNKFNYVVKRPQFSEELKQSASRMVSVIDKMMLEMKSFLAPYRAKMEEVYDKQREQEKLARLQRDAKANEKLKAERDAAVDKHPYKDIDETFIVKLDDIFGSGNYKISQCVYRIDYDSESIASYQVKELKSIFGGSKIEISERGDKITVFVTQNIEPIGTNREDYIEILHNYVYGLPSEDRTKILSFGKEKSKDVFNAIVEHFKRTGEYPSLNSIVNIGEKNEKEDAPKNILPSAISQGIDIKPKGKDASATVGEEIIRESSMGSTEEDADLPF